MQAPIERRADNNSRVPLQVPVELALADFDETFEADVVNVSPGGASMRAAYLPDVGERMTCRFSYPSAGISVEADSEVVWAAVDGAQSGAFGVRFVEVPTDTVKSLQLLAGCDTDSTLDEAVSDRRAVTTAVDLFVDGVASPVTGRVVRAGAHSLTVEQELPFLRIGIGVRIGADGARGAIEGAELSLRGDVPCLVLSVGHSSTRDTLPGVPTETLLRQAGIAESLAQREPELVPSRVVRQDDTSGCMPPEVVSAGLPELPQEPVVTAELPREPSAEQVAVRRPRVALGTEPAPAHSEAAPHDPEPSLDEALSGIRPTPVERLQQAVGWLQPRALHAWAVVRAWAAAIWTALRERSSGARDSAVPRIRHDVVTGARRLRAFAEVLMGRATGQLPRVMRRVRRRRTTTPPPARRRTRGGAREAEAPPRRNRRRVFFIGLLALSSGALVAYGLTPVGEGESVAAAVQAVKSASAAAPKAPGEGATAAASPAIDPASAGASVAAQEESARPSGLAAGPMPSPTFPSVDRAAVPASGGSTFGAAEVENGRTFTLRMSLPVTRIEGRSLNDGFQITVPGALSLDRAGPIAASHPLVSRSMVINRGDHAILTIRFARGQTPAYRVRASGRSIEVTIAR